MRRLTKSLISFVLPFITCSAMAQERLKLEPIPEPPPAPPGMLNDALEPQVTITKRGEDKVEEFRMSGKLYMLKVTPPGGVPYYLVDERGDGGFARQDPLDSRVRVPMWVIGTF